MPSDLSPFAKRLVPARPDLAADHLRGKVEADRFVAGTRQTVTASLVDLGPMPVMAGQRDTQLLRGEAFITYEISKDGLAWGQAEYDGYVGYVDASALGPPEHAGQSVTALWSHVYPEPRETARAGLELPYMARVPVSGTSGAFARLRGGGFVPRAHLARISADFVTEAERFIGVPYLWGGRSPRGLDCSALVQLGLYATGRVAVPRDSDMQEALLGVTLPPDAPLQRGDLVFWKGHVGIARDGETLLHANAHHMAVAVEPLAGVAERVAAADGGPVTSRRRIEGISRT